ncbi:MAG TPA: glycosyltransferase [Candidatus Avilachnospira avistercoris]|nr:glycosyltransferase [Candidatus Avilachnospira avistercoris]
MDKIAVLIPCYNEERTVKKVVSDWKRELPEAVIYVYDNNSTDRTAALAMESGAVVRHEYAQGKGNVVRRMFREIDAECYIMVDGDDTYPAESGRELSEAVLKRGADMVVGDRLSSTYFTENKRPFHNSGNTVVRSAINMLYGSEIKDIMTGLRAFSFQFVKTFPVLSTGFEIETEMTIHAVDKNMRIENVVIEYRDRPEGSSSKLNTIPDGLRVLRTIFDLFRNYRPAKFFGSIASVLALLSLIFVIPVFAEYFETGLVSRFPTLIVCGFALVSAIISFFSGLILSNINRRERQEFEFRLIQMDGEFKRLKDEEDNK